jgi:hypothetical protein
MEHQLILMPYNKLIQVSYRVHHTVKGCLKLERLVDRAILGIEHNHFFLAEAEQVLLSRNHLLDR